VLVSAADARVQQTDQHGARFDIRVWNGLAVIRPGAYVTAARTPATGGIVHRLDYWYALAAMDFHGKKVIALGERDGVQGEAIKDIAEELGARVVFSITQCFV
jgi:betaine reductase